MVGMISIGIVLPVNFSGTLLGKSYLTWVRCHVTSFFVVVVVGIFSDQFVLTSIESCTPTENQAYSFGRTTIANLDTK